MQRNSGRLILPKFVKSLQISFAILVKMDCKKYFCVLLNFFEIDDYIIRIHMVRFITIVCSNKATYAT